MFCTGTSTADPAVDADAPPAIANDTPATPNAGATFFRVFRFELVLARAIGILHTLRYVVPSRKIPVCTENSNSDIMVMQSTKDRVGMDTSSSLNWARERRVAMFAEQRIQPQSSERPS